MLNCLFLKTHNHLKYNMENNIYLVYPNNAESGTLETLPKTKGMILIKDSDLHNYTFNKQDKICITSEASLNLVTEKLQDVSKKEAIESLKDKYKFRKILTDIYPDYQYQKINFEEIENLSIPKKTILKPLKGCFGTAVKIVDKNSDLTQVSQEIKKELDKNASVLPKSVLSQNDFILEDFIEGEEYAIDMFYDDKGHPHIVNIYYHPMPKVNAYLHMIYYTNKDIFDLIYNKAIEFFKKLNKILKVTNLTLHSEFKYDTKLIPIEINPMRFGGMGLGNMIYHSLNINPYNYFNIGISPNWKDIWNSYHDECFTFFIAYNGSNINKNIQEPDIDKLKMQFTEVLCEQIFDYKTQLAFGVFSLKETPNNINNLLKIEFNNYFKPIIT